MVEKDLTLKLTHKIRAYLLENYECNVATSRNTDKAVSLSTRANMANKWGADLFLSVHCNGHYDKKANGFETFTHPAAPDLTKLYQEIIHNEIMKYLSGKGVNDRGQKQADFFVLRNTRMPAVLVEYLFVTGYKDHTLLKRKEILEGMARATAEGVGKALGLEETQEKGVFKDVPPGYWAEKYIEWAKEKGIIQGIGKGYFAEDESDRERKAEAAVMFHRFYEFLKKEG